MRSLRSLAAIHPAFVEFTFLVTQLIGPKSRIVSTDTAFPALSDICICIVLA